MLKPLPMTLVDADQAFATIAGRPHAATAEVGLSLGDRFYLAFAQRDGLPAVTADKQWRTIAGAAGVSVAIIR